MGKRRLVQAWRRDTGVMVMVPEHWLGHPELGKDFRKTQPPKDASVQVEEPQRPARRKNTDSQGG